MYPRIELISAPYLSYPVLILQVIQQHLDQSTLTIHLFGRKGNQKLYSKDFYK